jgi:transposase
MNSAAYPAAASEPFDQGRNKNADPLQSSSLHPRLAWMMCYNETGSAQEVCNKFSISRKTFYKWLKRYKESNGSSVSLTDRSRRPHRFPRATPESEIELLKQAKAQTGFGQRRLRVYMEQKYNISLSERTIWKILKREQETSHPTEL